MIVTVVFISLLSLCIAIGWVRGIDYMQENHPNYKGEDLFDEDDETAVR